MPVKFGTPCETDACGHYMNYHTDIGIGFCTYGGCECQRFRYTEETEVVEVTEPVAVGVKPKRGRPRARS